MELFRIGGPNPDTNYLFMGMRLLYMATMTGLIFDKYRRLR
jgi:hypothetical protein